MERRFYDDREAMFPEQRQSYLEEKLRETVLYAYRNAPATKKRLDEAGIDPSGIGSIKDLESIPITKKEEILQLQKENPPFGGLVAVPIEAIRVTFVSIGPFYFPWAVEEEGLKASAAALYAMGLRKGDVALITFALTFPVVRGMEECLVKIGIMPVPTGPGSTDFQIEVMRHMGVTGYIGSLTFLSNIIKRTEEQGYDFRRDFKLRVVIAGAEMIPLAERMRLEKDYSLSISDFYGGTEVGQVGYNCSEKSGYHFSPDKIVEIVDPSTGKQLGPGETGEVVVTTFSKTLPLIRFSLSDLSYYTNEPCPCGRTSDRLVRILGRVGDLVKVRALFVLPQQVEQAAAAFPEISAFQAEVSRPQKRDEMTFKIELKDETVDREKLAQSLKEEFMRLSRVKLDKVEFVPKGTIPESRKSIVDVRKWD